MSIELCIAILISFIHLLNEMCFSKVFVVCCGAKEVVEEDSDWSYEPDSSEATIECSVSGKRIAEQSKNLLENSGSSMRSDTNSGKNARFKIARRVGKRRFKVKSLTKFFGNMRRKSCNILAFFQCCFWTKYGQVHPDQISVASADLSDADVVYLHHVQEKNVRVCAPVNHMALPTMQLVEHSTGRSPRDSITQVTFISQARGIASGVLMAVTNLPGISSNHINLLRRLSRSILRETAQFRIPNAREANEDYRISMLAIEELPCITSYINIGNGSPGSLPTTLHKEQKYIATLVIELFLFCRFLVKG